MKKENNKNERKRSYLFELIVLCILCFIVFFVCGCASCGIKSDSKSGHSLSGCTIPGCGGCLSSGRGCNSCIYSENIACFSWKPDNDAKSDGGLLGAAYEPSMSITACDNIYLGSCMGCGSNEHHMTCGYLSIDDDDTEGCFSYTGNSDNCGGKKGVKVYGCLNGEVGCNTDDSIDMDSLLGLIEREHGLIK